MSYNRKKYSLPECIPPDDCIIEPDYELLKELLYFQTPSLTVHEHNFINWLIEWVKVNKIDAETHKDSYGNLYITKGESNLYPCIVAHADINQDFKEDWEIFMSSKIMFGFDNEEGKQCGMGADDKCGVAFALQMLLREDIQHLKVFIPLSEEVGCKGTKQARMSWFKDCSLLIQLDRRSDSNDISSYTNGVEVVSKEFVETMTDLNLKYDYAFEECVYTDIGELAKQGVGIVAFNVSCGYTSEHSDTEVLSLSHFKNAINYGYEIITSLGSVKWPHTAKPSFKKSKWEDYEDYYLPTREKSEMPAYHSCENYKFNKMDELYIQDMLATGTCPCCNSSGLEYLIEEEQHCWACESTFNIPYGKSMEDIQEELWQILLEKEESKNVELWKD